MVEYILTPTAQTITKGVCAVPVDWRRSAMTGTLINAILVVLGSLIGLALRKRLPERYGKTLMQGIALFVLFIGGQMATETAQPLIPLISLALGGILGEFLMIEDRLEAFSLRMEQKFAAETLCLPKASSGSSLLFVVGPMAIIGSINDGLQGDHSLLLAKSIMDGFSAIAFASTMGIGCYSRPSLSLFTKVA